jgi:S1-C subfamily serine protease
VRIAAVHQSRPRTAAVVEPGMIVARLGGIPTPDPQSFARAVEKSLKGAAGQPGERVSLSVVWEGREQTISAPVEAPYAAAASWSPRHTGFPAAFWCEAPVLARECGSPLVGTDGKVAAIVIARIGPEAQTHLDYTATRTYAIPAEIVRTVVADLRRQAESALEP